MPANTSRKDTKSKSPIIKSSVCGLISSALFFAFIVLFAFISLKSDFSASAYMPAGLFFGALTGFIGGFISAKLSNEKGALYGLLSGAVQTFICFIFLFFYIIFVKICKSFGLLKKKRIYFYLR